MTGSLARDSRRPPFSGPAFTRLLAALNDVPVAPAAVATSAFAERLSRWFDWTDAISLSAAIGNSTDPVRKPILPEPPLMNVDEREFARVRASLARRVADTVSPVAEPAHPGRLARAAVAVPAAPDDFPALRQRYVACQQAMETSIPPLRRRIRSTLAGAAPALGRLADLDVVMEQVLGEQERALLATVPSRLERRFERLRQAGAVLPGAQDTASADEPGAAWLDVFRGEMRDILLAELDLRLQPVEGLLDALRTSAPD